MTGPVAGGEPEGEQRAHRGEQAEGVPVADGLGEAVARDRVERRPSWSGKSRVASPYVADERRPRTRGRRAAQARSCDGATSSAGDAARESRRACAPSRAPSADARRPEQREERSSSRGRRARRGNSSVQPVRLERDVERQRDRREPEQGERAQPHGDREVAAVRERQAADDHACGDAERHAAATKLRRHVVRTARARAAAALSTIRHRVGQSRRGSTQPPSPDPSYAGRPQRRRRALQRRRHVRLRVSSRLNTPGVTATMSARWISRNVCRIARMRSRSSSISGTSRQRSRAQRRSSRMRSSSGPPSPFSSQAFRARPRTPTVSGWRVQRSGRRHRQVLVDPREHHRLAEGVAAGRGGRLERLLAVGDPVRVAGEHVADPVVVVARRRARCAARSAASSAAGRTGSRTRTAPAPARPGGRSRAGRSGSRPRCRRRRPSCPARRRISVAEVGDAGVGDDQLRVRVAVDEAREVGGDRRQAAAAVDQDRHPPLGRDREDGREPLVVQQEPLRARVELDPPRAEVEAALGLLDRALGQVEADERDEAALGARGELERAVVRRRGRRGAGRARPGRT